MEVSQEVAERFNEVRKEVADLMVHTSTLPNKELQNISRRFRHALAQLESVLFPAGGAVESDLSTDDQKEEEKAILARILEELQDMRVMIRAVQKGLFGSSGPVSE